jgi:hypothetical protein
MELERHGDGCEPEQDLTHATATGRREARALGARGRESFGEEDFVSATPTTAAPCGST